MRNVDMARCSRCDSDLVVHSDERFPVDHSAHSDGCLYCTNTACPFHRKAHPTPFHTNAGKTADRP